MKINHKGSTPILCIALCLMFIKLSFAANISSIDKYNWAENAGWMNWKSLHSQIFVYDDHLEGFIWSENIGWIHIGTNHSGGAHTYANTTASNYGVNRDDLNKLSGYGWSESSGWINFNPQDNQVTIDPISHSITGYAWGENIGWIHFIGQNYSTVLAVPDGFDDVIAPINEDESIDIDVLLNDSFGADGSANGILTIVNSPNHGEAIVQTMNTPLDPLDDTILYTPSLDFNGLDSFVYQIQDASGDTSTAHVYLTVNAVNDPPEFTSIGNLSYPLGGRHEQIINWIISQNAGPNDEPSNALSYTTEIISDSHSVLNTNNPPFVDATNGNLSIHLSGEGGIATLEVTLDDGATQNNQSITSEFLIEVERVADLEISITNNLDVLPGGESIHYFIRVANNGPADISNAIVVAETPTGLSLNSWNCTGTGTCGTNTGVTDILESVQLPIDSYVIYDLIVSVQASPEIPVEFSALVQTPGDTQESNIRNNSAVEKDIIGISGFGFEN